MEDENGRRGVAKFESMTRRIYLQEDRYDSPKEYFKAILRKAQASGALREGACALDVGCATGEFLHYLKRQHPGLKCVGIDVMPDLIERARRRVSVVDFRVGSVQDASSFPAGAADLVFAHGLLSILRDFRVGLRNLLSWCRPGGVVYIFGLFNPHPVDVWITYRRADDPDESEVEMGWHYMSKVSYSHAIDQEIGGGTPFIHAVRPASGLAPARR